MKRLLTVCLLSLLAPSAFGDQLMQSVQAP